MRYYTRDKTDLADKGRRLQNAGGTQQDVAGWSRTLQDGAVWRSKIR